MSNNQRQDTSQWITVNYDLKSQVKLFVGERSKTQFESGCKMFDLYLHEPFNVTLEKDTT